MLHTYICVVQLPYLSLVDGLSITWDVVSPVKRLGQGWTKYGKRPDTQTSDETSLENAWASVEFIGKSLGQGQGRK